jgi:hypothetical protein
MNTYQVIVVETIQRDVVFTVEAESEDAAGELVDLGEDGDGAVRPLSESIIHRHVYSVNKVLPHGG